MATHPFFQALVVKAGLGYSNVGGDSMELMGYMVKNARLLPSKNAVVNGDVSRNRKAMREIMETLALLH